MTTLWEIVFALPICVATFCFLFLGVQKIKPLWVALAVVYAAGYFTVFHFVFKAL